jgi:hypothetical protein
MKRLSLALAAIVLAPALAWAHGGGLDSHGCHNDKKAGDYHCHKGKHNGASFKNQAAMLELDKKNAKVDKEQAAKEEKKKDDKKKK